MNNLKLQIREVELELTKLFSKEIVFSSHLIKYEDNELKDKYDNNYFEYSEQFSKEELSQTIDYQLNRNDNFLKFFGRSPLDNNYGIEEGCDLTMLLDNKDVSSWKENKNLSFRKPDIEDIKQLELKHYGDIYGKEFTIKNVEHLSSKLEYLGAYLDNILVGICVPYISDKYCCIDEILVDDQYRKQYVCTSLLKFVALNNKDKYIFLHADNDDTPKNLYAKLGFKEIDKKYCYQVCDLKKYLDEGHYE